MINGSQIHSYKCWCMDLQFVHIFFWIRFIGPTERNMKDQSCKSEGSVNPFITFLPTNIQNNSWTGNHPANQTRPRVCFWWDAGAANTIWSLPDLISVIDWNNRRSETMKQSHYVCPCHIASVWWREDPVFTCEVRPWLQCQGGWQIIKACGYSLYQGLIDTHFFNGDYTCKWF